jgi:hypothetical protein
MGQQQLLLVLLGVIIVGAAIVIGVFMFSDSAASANRDAISTDLTALAVRAQSYYRRPKIVGGGGSDFTGLTMPKMTSRSSNANGSYVLTSVSTDHIVLTGIGKEIGNDGNIITITSTVYADSVITNAPN